MRASTSARAALDQQLEDPLEVGLPTDGPGDRGRRLQRRDSAFELVAAGGDAAVQPRVLDRDRGPVGEDDERLLVGLVELAVGLLGQVEVAVGLAADEDRHAQEAVHRRMAEGEAVRARVVADVGHAQRPRVADEDAEDPVPSGQVADRAVGLRVDPAGQEALELPAAVVEDAERRVARAGQLARHLEHAVEDDLEVELGHH